MRIPLRASIRDIMLLITMIQKSHWRAPQLTAWKLNVETESGINPSDDIMLAS
jgi:hypothetical protein